MEQCSPFKCFSTSVQCHCLSESCHWQCGFPECRVWGKGAQNQSLSLTIAWLPHSSPVPDSIIQPFTHSLTHSFPRSFIHSCPVTSNPGMRPMPGAEARRGRLTGSTRELLVQDSLSTPSHGPINQHVQINLSGLCYKVGPLLHRRSMLKGSQVAQGTNHIVHMCRKAPAH